MAKKLSQWAKDNNYSYGGALKAFHRGDIPGAFQLESGTILVEEEIEKGASTSKNRAALYSRVSTRKQDESLKNQSERLNLFALGKGFQVVKDVQEIGSGLNGNRKKLHSLFDNHEEWDVLVVEHKDRLARFGTEFLETLLKSLGKEVIYVYSEEEKGDLDSLAEDIVSVLASLSGKLYGKRGAQAKAKKAVEEVMKQ